ncbi:hypothetical protein ESA94_10560 [Lacibacter luteus]|uniref:DUF3575 domain-containing protein n=1 Tax=Lacibacter luteus TaxID=2508719 RepID=A0A4Q1CJU8_9BACT|nr:hypothetical protein [Lacibacter luteus]RXK60890.1 hypothetical protein ESA94_10560 [Lacibacter luteus]
MKKLFLAILLSSAFYVAQAQNETANSPEYKTAIGAKLWTGGGVSIKTFIKDNNALEFIGFFDRYGTRITGLYEIHGNLSSEGALKWYVGPGAHVGLYKGITAVGIDGVVGIDYKFTNMPLNLALDWQPSFELGSGTRNGFNANWGGFAIRFTL